MAKSTSLLSPWTLASDAVLPRVESAYAIFPYQRST